MAPGIFSVLVGPPWLKKDWGEFLNVLSHSGLSPSSLKQDICPYEGNECVFTSSDPFPLKLCNIKIHSRKTLVEAFRVSPPFVLAINGISIKRVSEIDF